MGCYKGLGFCTRHGHNPKEPTVYKEIIRRMPKKGRFYRVQLDHRDHVALKTRNPKP